MNNLKENISMKEENESNIINKIKEEPKKQVEETKKKEKESIVVVKNIKLKLNDNELIKNKIQEEDEEEEEDDDNDDEKIEEIYIAYKSQIEELEKEVEKFKNLYNEKEKKANEELQDLLTGAKEDFIYEKNSLKCLIDYKIGDIIDNDKFLIFMRNGLSTLYSYDKKVKQSVFNFFKRIQKKIKDFIYIPLLKDSSLNEIKKQIYLGVISNQIEQMGADDTSLEYIFYTDSYFNESPFEEIIIRFKRDKQFIEFFNEYKKKHEFKLNLDNIKDFIFSTTILETYFETCKEIFGKDASFITIDNIKKALNKIYENIVKNIKFAKLPKFNYGMTIYREKIFISDSFLKNIKKTKNKKKS